MAAALVSIFISFLTSEGAIREKIESLDAEKHGVKDLSEWTQWLNRASAVLVVAGVALLLVFAAKNLAGAPAMPSNRDDGLKKGYVPPDPPPARPGRPPAPPPTRQPDPQPPAKKP